MSTLLSKRHFVCADLEKNMYRFWRIELYDNARVITTFGRVGTDGQTDDKTFQCQAEADRYFNKKLADKQKVKSRRDSYTEITVLDETVSASKTIQSHHLSDIAVKQIKTNDDSVKELIRFLSDINIHNIVSSTQIKYNIDDGTFKTSLGVVSKEDIDEAAKLLDQISKLPTGQDKELLKLTNAYLRKIPQDLGGSHIKIRLKDIFGTPDLLEKQNEIVQSLQAGLSTTKPLTTTEEQVFSAELNLVDQPTLARIKLKVGSKKIANVYTVNIESVKNNWEKYGSKLEFKENLWHATNPANVLSIIQRGFIIPKTFSNGRNHGDGVYFSDRLTKSLQYAPQSKKGNKYVQYVFLSDVALGNVYYGGGKSITSNYNSLWYDKSGSESQVVVYRIDQFNILYLVEFE